jgi:outer membrane biosynthesis protein TonB
MRAAKLRSLCVLTAILCTGCSHKTPATPQQAQAPPLQTGKGTLTPPKTTQQAEKTDTPLASPLPPPSAQNVPLPPPTPKKVRKPKKPKPADTPPATAAAPAASAQTSSTGAGSITAQAAPQPVAATVANTSAIGQLTTGDSALGERTKHEAADLIGATQQGLGGIKRPLSNDEKATAAQIHNYLKQAQQALDNGDADGAHLLATKAKVLLDELTKP